MISIAKQRALLSSVRGLMYGLNDDEADGILAILYSATDRMLSEAKELDKKTIVTKGM